MYRYVAKLFPAEKYCHLPAWRDPVLLAVAVGTAGVLVGAVLGVAWAVLSTR